MRTLQDDQSSEAAAVTRDYDLKLERLPGGAPVLSVIGGKITTYRKLAEAALTRLLPLLGRASISWTATAALPGGDLPEGDFRSVSRRGPARAGRSCPMHRRAVWRERTGPAWNSFLGTPIDFDALGETFGDELTSAEVQYLREHEWALTAKDVLWRRTKLGLRVSAA